MIVVRQLSFARGAQILVKSASLQIAPGWKVGLTGSNGCGKSSFFALMNGELNPEQGELNWPPSWIIAHVAQETPALPDSALEFVLDGDTELRQIEQALQNAEQINDGAHIGTLHARLADIGGYSAQARAASLLYGLGFGEDDYARPVAEFSGGWRVRLNLARALMCRSDLLLLDEPTNHLDLDAICWLENWLRQYPGTLLMISHDRDFLDAIATHILHIEQQTLKIYAGHYSAFERQRAAQLALQQSMFEKQQREIAHLHRFIDRFRAKATKARQAQSRMKALERMEEVAAAHVDTPFTFRFREPLAAPDPLLVLHQASIGYTSKPLLSALLSELELTLRPGERIALLGCNGSGKSTLIKALAGILPLLSGQRIEGKGLAIGYFAQHQLEQLRSDESPLQHLLRLAPTTREQELRDYLGRFDFRGERSSTPCGNFSGGEKSRLALALIIWNQPNLLLLDEPTNHLDLEMREALTLALQTYEGGVVLVSHDRHLLRTSVDSFWCLTGARLAPFEGDLDDYANTLNKTSAHQIAAIAPTKAKTPKPNRQQHKTSRQQQLNQRRPLLKALEQLEQQLGCWSQEKIALDTALADPGLYQDIERSLLANTLKQQAELCAKIAQAEENWLEIHAQLAALEALEKQ